MTPSERSRRGFVVALVTWLTGFCAAPSQAQPLDLTQYAHTAWRVRDGFTNADISAIAQTPDGYLWLGTVAGLFHFDGMRAVPWRPPGPEQLPSEFIQNLTVTRDGTLWIGTLKGLASWKDGKLTNYPEITKASTPVVEGADGTLWFGRPFPGEVCRLRGAHAECSGDGKLKSIVLSIAEDRKGNLWVSAVTGLWRWAPGEPKQFPLPDKSGSGKLTLDTDGALLIEGAGRLWRMVDEVIHEYPLPGLSKVFSADVPFTPSQETPSRNYLGGGLLRSRDGGLWLSTRLGVLHVQQGKSDLFTMADGLSYGSVQRIFEDREGNIWISTLDGFDRFRVVPVRTFSARQGLASSTAWSVQATADGDVWIGTPAGLNRVTDGRLSVVNDSHVRGPVYALGLDGQGQLLASTTAGLVSNRGGRFESVPGVSAGPVAAIVTDARQRLWVSTTSRGLFRRSPDGTLQHVVVPPPPASSDPTVRSMLADPRGGIWIGYLMAGFGYLVDDKVAGTYRDSAAALFGDTTDFRLGSDGGIWVSGGSGVARYQDGQAVLLARKNGMPCGDAQWTMEDDDHALWIYLACGLVRIEQSEWQAWVKDPTRVVKHTLLGTEEGVRIRRGGSAIGPLVTKATDGRIWFVVTDGVSVLDPRGVKLNPYPPQVQIERITADGSPHDTALAGGRLRLAPSLRNLEIDFTALSFASPEQVRFRFKLDGQDLDWREVVNQRHVAYSNLGPGTYRFHVMAANASGVWSNEAAVLEFDVAPAFYQRRAFFAAMAAACLLLIGLSYRFRVRQISRTLSRRFDERLDERTRVARELHDTFLQTVQGSKLVADHALRNGTDHDGVMRAMRQLSDWLTKATDEARSALNSLRASTTATNDLAEAFRRAADESGSTSRADISLSVQGDARQMHPMVRDEVYRIGYEAIRNACVHSAGDRIAISLEYGNDLTLRVTDNGIGIDPAILEKGKEGHFGLRGMKERAERIDARLSIVSSAQAGTTVTIVVPGRAAFRSIGKRDSAHQPTSGAGTLPRSSPDPDSRY